MHTDDTRKDADDPWKGKAPKTEEGTVCFKGGKTRHPLKNTGKKKFFK